jgi:hypothetical protein
MTTTSTTQNHWIIRVADGQNFKNSNYAFWGVKRGRNGCIKTIVQKIKKRDILWFLTSKEHGGKLIGMAEYISFYDRMDEPLLQINTLTNEEQNWKGTENWDIQIHYCNLYNTERQNIIACIQCGGIILEYNTFKDKIKGDLLTYYTNYLQYAEPIPKPII